MKGKNQQVKKSKNQQGRDRSITRKVIAWFGGAARPLPWRRMKRGRRCGWAGLVAEAMLQQTQVSRVIDRFDTFIKRYPTPAHLAAAGEQDVLAAWQGLGYYRRARHLHQAATMIVERFGGQVPRDVNHLMQLPGVGRYTAGAIASIVYGRAEPIVDGNVHRVLARLEANHGGMSWAWKRAEELVRIADAPGPFNEALMELGSTICTPRNPKCSACPLARCCAANRDDLQHEIPSAKTPPKRKHVHHHAVIIRRLGRMLLEQRPASGLWAGMWQTPTIESDAPLTRDEIASRLRVPVQSLASGGSFEHQTSHRRITFHVFTARSRARRGVWREPHDCADLAMSNAQRRILREFAFS